MNYILNLCGINRTIFDITSKLLIETFRESDYSLDTYSEVPENYYAPLKLKMVITGSRNKHYETLVLDFDNLIIRVDDEMQKISTKSLGINFDPKGTHYWGITGKLFTFIKDISPAYISGYLVQAKLENELKIFREFSTH